MEIKDMPILLVLSPLIVGWAVCTALGCITVYAASMFIAESLMKLLGIYKLFIRFMFAYYGKTIAPEPLVETVDSLKLRKLMSDLIDIFDDIQSDLITEEQWDKVFAAQTERNFFNTRSK
jgi:hypothetical protein